MKGMRVNVELVIWRGDYKSGVPASNGGDFDNRLVSLSSTLLLPLYLLSLSVRPVFGSFSLFGELLGDLFVAESVFL